MPTRKASWAIFIWTGFMALGIAAAALGIGGECRGLTGGEFAACEAAAWVRGNVGLFLLVILWLVGLVPLAFVWSVTRPKGDVRSPGDGSLSA